MAHGAGVGLLGADREPLKLQVLDEAPAQILGEVARLARNRLAVPQAEGPPGTMQQLRIEERETADRQREAAFAERVLVRQLLKIGVNLLVAELIRGTMGVLRQLADRPHGGALRVAGEPPRLQELEKLSSECRHRTSLLGDDGFLLTRNSTGSMLALTDVLARGTV